MAGFRTALKHKSLPTSCTGAKATFRLPSSSNLNTVTGGNVAYFFINVNSDNGGNYDGGVYKKGSQWYVFIYGAAGWTAAPIYNLDGDTIDIELFTTSSNGGEITLRVDGLSVRSLTNHWTILDIVNNSISELSYEMNLVPEDEDWSNFNETNSDGQGFFKYAYLYNASPIGADVNDASYTVYVANSDDGSYENACDDACTLHSYSDTKLKSSINLNLAGQVF